MSFGHGSARRVGEVDQSLMVRVDAPRPALRYAYSRCVGSSYAPFLLALVPFRLMT